MTTNEKSQSQAVFQNTTDSSSERWTLIFMLLILIGGIFWAMFSEWHNVQAVSSSKIEQLDNSCVIDSVKTELSSSRYEFLTNGRLKELAYYCEKEQKEALQNAQSLRNNDIQLKALEKTLK